MSNFTIPRPLKAALVAGAVLGLAGCTYGGAGYYGDGYVNNQRYECDPYAPFNDYYACDYGYGFANIGYGGGWYDQYYYPGYGVYIFDRGGRRHAMRDNHRRYWARQRAEYGGHHARDRNPQRRGEWRDRRNDRGFDGRDQRRGNWRDQRNDRRDDARDQRRRDYRDNPRTRRDLGVRPGTGVTRPDRATPDRNGGNRATGTVRRPTGAVQQRQARPQPQARPVPRNEGPRISPRTPLSERGNVVDE